MTRLDGRKLVAGVTAVTVAAVALGEIYLPYIADRDKVRGMFEEAEAPENVRKEMQEYMKQQQAKYEQEKTTKGQNVAGSMWKAMSGGGGSRNEK
jgi:hypothetical protein